MNLWNRVIFDALQTRDSGTVLKLSMLYVPLLAVSVLLSITQLCARMTIQRRWRKWLNKLLSDRWLKNGRYYQLDLVAGGHKNPECRIADDVRIATEAPIELATGATSAILSAVMFIVVFMDGRWNSPAQYRANSAYDSRFSRLRRGDLCGGRECGNVGCRSSLDQSVGDQESSGG
jgi:ABC-type uncharacterized transport system fused permease/ATPase subunit